MAELSDRATRVDPAGSVAPAGPEGRMDGEPDSGADAGLDGGLDSALDGGLDVEVVDDPPRRVRRQLDLVRIVGLLLLLGAVALVGTYADDTTGGANDDLAGLLRGIPELLVRGLSLFGTIGALALPVGLVVREIVRSQARRLIEGIGTGLLALGVVLVLDVALSADATSSLHESLTRASGGVDVRPLDPYLAALVALVLIVGIAGDPTWRTAFIVAVGVYAVSAFAAGQASLLALIASPAIGAVVGLVVRFAAGSVNERPDAARVAAAVQGRLRAGGHAIVRIERVPRDPDRPRVYRATTDAGEVLTVEVLDRDLIASGAVYGVYRRLRIRTAVAKPPPLSLERVAEGRSLLGYAAMAAGARVPTFLGAAPCGPDAVVLIYECIASEPLAEPTDEQLQDLWTNVLALHGNRITHRSLAADRIMQDAQGRVVLPSLTGGATFASDLRIAVDRAQLLVVTAQMVGAERAVVVAATMLTDQELAACVPLLQPIALTRETRTALRRDAELLEDVREQIHERTLDPIPEATRIERFRPRTVLSIVALIVAGYLLVGQVGSVDLLTVFSGARWGWVPLVLLASAITYIAAALCLTGYVRERLSFGRTVAVQLAASFAGFVTPPSVGGLAVNLRYLRQMKISATNAATSVGMSQAMNAISHAALLIVVAAATGASAETELPIPGWAFAALGAATVLVLLLLTIPSARRWLVARVVPPLREAGPRLLSLLSNPLKLTEAIGGALLLNGAYIAALWFSVRAFGGGATLAAVAVVYLAGAAVASAAPTPGGLGAVEVALSTGLTAAGMGSAAAVSAVLLFRIATFWLPVPVGWLAFHVLQRKGAL
jgi:uncharacterized membrane protein YbhN (UPF0104 family)